MISVKEARTSLGFLKEAIQGLVAAKRDGWWDEGVSYAFQPLVMSIGLLDLYLTGSMHQRLDTDKEAMALILGEEWVIKLSDDHSEIRLVWPDEQNTQYLYLVTEDDPKVNRKWKLLISKGDNHVESNF